MFSGGNNFFIPVMGIAFTVDTPVKAGLYGIDSVLSLVDDQLLEDLRAYYCKTYDFSYEPVKKPGEDYRARRVKEYLNVLNKVQIIEFDKIKQSHFTPDSPITKYFDLLPEDSWLKKDYLSMMDTPEGVAKSELQQKLRSEIKPGSIDVNVMVKLDRDIYIKGEKQDTKYAEAVAALRGYAASDLESSIILSAGFNRRLMMEMVHHQDFYPDEKGYIKKKLVLKVSDYRSAFMQAKMFAKQGLWVSEFRIESGLDCGGHAFATEGFLMGPIMKEFQENKETLIDTAFEIFKKATEKKNPGMQVSNPPKTIITAQGGVGTASEHQMLIKYFEMDGVGWGSPFLFVPEVVNIDEVTLQRLEETREGDIVQSDASPLGVIFNNMMNSPSELSRLENIKNGNPGSACPNGHLSYNTEFTDIPVCVASRFYQRKKIHQLQELDLDPKDYQEQYDKVVVKSCICKDLSAPSEIAHHLPVHGKEPTTAICPGPNAAYFTRKFTLKEMVHNIQGKIESLHIKSRSHMFINELKLYINYLKKELTVSEKSATEQKTKSLKKFSLNLQDAIKYYKHFAEDFFKDTKSIKEKFLTDLSTLTEKLNHLVDNSKLLKVAAATS